MGLPYNAIPEDTLPQCWSDDVRMNALFAPFRIKSANPESWDMKMKFWSDMLRQWCKYKRDPIVSASDAKFAFQRKGRTPACIDIVVEELFRNGELSPISKYQQILHNPAEGWVRWTARLAFKPAALALTAVTSLLPATQSLDSDGLPKASIDSTSRFVLESAVQEQATQMLENYPLGVERVGTIEELMRNCNWQQSRETFEILVGWLVATGAATKKGDVVKLAEPNKKVSPVTETDEALVKLVSAESRLCGDAARLSREVASCEAEARAALTLGNRIAAKNHLRRKHRAQQKLEQCEGALENVQQLLHQIRDVDTNAAIVNTYKTTSEAMKRGMKEGGLDEDAVHDTMDDLNDVMESYKEVERALSTTTDDLDAAELEAELRELMSPGAPGGGGAPAKETTPRKAQEPSPLLPTPPKHQPRKVSERDDFVFDGEARVIAELNELSVGDAQGGSGGRGLDKRGRKKIAVTEQWVDAEKPEPKTPKPSKSWYPPTKECLQPETWNNNDFGELRQDERLHPGQPLNVDFTTPPRLYSSDFQVRDHKPCAGVWLYSTRDNNSNVDDLAASTEYFSSESPGKSGGSFQMAPGGERKASAAWNADGDAPVDDLERRLRNLRGFNL
ncbi:charged multivesicular body protein 7 [Pectinophora gossypiella]|nr:charged multivesicular body protein 7 [Pectinophora gossypiella]